MLRYLGLACREARERAGLRQIDIATAAGTTHVTISRLERGHKWPIDPGRIVQAYADELGLEAADLWCTAAQAFREGHHSE